MLSVFLAASISQSEVDRSEMINRFCSYVVGIPYASDNFNDEEWNRFQFCREHLE